MILSYDSDIHSNRVIMFHRKAWVWYLWRGWPSEGRYSRLEWETFYSDMDNRWRSAK